MTRKIYSDEYKQDVVTIALKGESTIAEVAKDFGISRTALDRWVKNHKATLGQSSKPNVEQSNLKELAAANKRIILLEQEAEVMRRAVGYLSRGVNPK